jgi:outer membrane lipoprotein-sorting protein
MNMIKNGQKGKLKWAVAVAALAVVAILAGTIPKVGETGLAFAQVVQRIQQIQTVTFENVLTWDGGAEPKRQLFKAPNLWRCEWVRSGNVAIIDTKARKTLNYFPRTKTYFCKEEVDFGQNPNLNPLDRIAEIKAGTVETLPEKELAGHKVVGFRAPLLDIFKAPLPKDRATMVTIWADAATGDPVQVEFNHASGDVSVWSDFQVNVPLDDALFSVTPPEGYTFQAP